MTWTNRTRLGGASLVLWSALASGCRCADEVQPAVDPLPKPTPAPPASASGASATHTVSLEAQIRAARDRRVQFQAPDDTQAKDYLSWLHHVAEAAWSDGLPEQTPPPGFTGRLAESGSLWMLVEQPARRRGAGVVILRPAATVPVIVEAPHSFFEPETLKLSVQVFQELQARALLVNTAHRGGLGNRDERVKLALSGDSPSDVAHNPNSHFARAHRSLVAMDPSVTTLQLHGFRDDGAKGVEVIVSAARSTARIQPLVSSLKQLLGSSKVKSYPDEIEVLGGTRNEQAKVSRELKSPFVHLELAASLRQRLAKDDALVRAFAQALGKGVLGWE